MLHGSEVLVALGVGGTKRRLSLLEKSRNLTALTGDGT